MTSALAFRLLTTLPIFPVFFRNFVGSSDIPTSEGSGETAEIDKIKDPSWRSRVELIPRPSTGFEEPSVKNPNRDFSLLGNKESSVSPLYGFPIPEEAGLDEPTAQQEEPTLLETSTSTKIDSINIVVLGYEPHYVLDRISLVCSAFPRQEIRVFVDPEKSLVTIAERLRVSTLKTFKPGMTREGQVKDLLTVFANRKPSEYFNSFSLSRTTQAQLMEDAERTQSELDRLVKRNTNLRIILMQDLLRSMVEESQLLRRFYSLPYVQVSEVIAKYAILSTIPDTGIVISLNEIPLVDQTKLNNLLESSFSSNARSVLSEVSKTDLTEYVERIWIETHPNDYPGLTSLWNAAEKFSWVREEPPESLLVFKNALSKHFSDSSASLGNFYLEPQYSGKFGYRFTEESSFLFSRQGNEIVRPLLLKFMTDLRNLNLPKTWKVHFKASKAKRVLRYFLDFAENELPVSSNPGNLLIRDASGSPQEFQLRETNFHPSRKTSQTLLLPLIVNKAKYDLIVACVNEDAEPSDTTTVLGTAEELFQRHKETSALATVGKARPIEFGEDFVFGRNLRVRIVGEAYTNKLAIHPLQLTTDMNMIMKDILETRGGTVEPLEIVEFLSCLRECGGSQEKAETFIHKINKEVNFAVKEYQLPFSRISSSFKSKKRVAFFGNRGFEAFHPRLTRSQPRGIYLSATLESAKMAMDITGVEIRRAATMYINFLNEHFRNSIPHLWSTSLFMQHRKIDENGKLSKMTESDVQTPPEFIKVQRVMRDTRLFGVLGKLQTAKSFAPGWAIVYLIRFFIRIWKEKGSFHALSTLAQAHIVTNGILLGATTIQDVFQYIEIANNIVIHFLRKTAIKFVFPPEIVAFRELAIEKMSKGSYLTKLLKLEGNSSYRWIVRINRVFAKYSQFSAAVGKVLGPFTIAFQAITVVLDSFELAHAKKYHTKVVAGVRLGFDSVGFVLSAVSLGILLLDVVNALSVSIVLFWAGIAVFFIGLLLEYEISHLSIPLEYERYERIMQNAYSSTGNYFPSIVEHENTRLFNFAFVNLKITDSRIEPTKLTPLVYKKIIFETDVTHFQYQAIYREIRETSSRSRIFVGTFNDSEIHKVWKTADSILLPVTAVKSRTCASFPGTTPVSFYKCKEIEEILTIIDIDVKTPKLSFIVPRSTTHVTYHIKIHDHTKISSHSIYTLILGTHKTFRLSKAEEAKTKIYLTIQIPHRILAPDIYYFSKNWFNFSLDTVDFYAKDIDEIYIKSKAHDGIYMAESGNFQITDLYHTDIPFIDFLTYTCIDVQENGNKYADFLRIVNEKKFAYIQNRRDGIPRVIYNSFSKFEQNDIRAFTLLGFSNDDEGVFYAYDDEERIQLYHCGDTQNPTSCFEILKDNEIEHYSFKHSFLLVFLKDLQTTLIVNYPDEIFLISLRQQDALNLSEFPDFAAGVLNFTERKKFLLPQAVEINFLRVLQCGITSFLFISESKALIPRFNKESFLTSLNECSVLTEQSRTGFNVFVRNSIESYKRCPDRGFLVNLNLKAAFLVDQVVTLQTEDGLGFFGLNCKGEYFPQIIDFQKKTEFPSVPNLGDKVFKTSNEEKNFILLKYGKRGKEFMISLQRFFIPLTASYQFFDVDSSRGLHLIGIDLIYDCAVVIHPFMKNGSCLVYHEIFSDSNLLDSNAKKIIVQKLFLSKNESEEIYRFDVLETNLLGGEYFVKNDIIEDGFHITVRDDGIPTVSLVFKSTLGFIQSKNFCDLNYTSFPCLHRRREFPKTSMCDSSMKFLTQNHDFGRDLHFFCPSQEKIVKFNSATETYSYLPFNCTEASIVQDLLIIFISSEHEFTIPLIQGIHYLKMHIDNTKLSSVENFPILSAESVSFYSSVTIVYRTLFNLDFISDEPKEIRRSIEQVDYAFSGNPENLLRFQFNL